MASKTNRENFLLMLFVFGMLCLSIANADAPPSPCGYTCGANKCQEVKEPAGCSDSCPDPPDTCVLCTSTSCQGDCVPKDPNLNYYPACFDPDKFDWTKGDLASLPKDLIAKNFDKIGNRISELSEEQKQAFIDALIAELNLPPGSVDLSQCNSALSCGITIDSNGKIVLSSGGVTLDISLIKLSDGASVTAIQPKGWQFNIPANGEIEIAGVKLKSTNGGTVTWNGEYVTLSQGTSLTYTDPIKGTTTTVFSKLGDTNVYFGVDVPPGKTGVAINGPASNGDGVQIVGVTVAVAHTTADGQTIGIITDNMTPTDEVILKRQADLDLRFGHTTYLLDLTKAGNSNVKFTNGFEGLTFDGDSMFQCNQATGSCPYDPKTNIALLVKWNGPGGITIPGYEGTFLLVQGQSGIQGANILICPCDKKVPCDVGCSCDMICGLCDPITKPEQECLPEWMYITLGYGNYLKCTKPPSSIACNEKKPAKDFCCQQYGADYKPLAFVGRVDVCEPGTQYDKCQNKVVCRQEDDRRCYNVLLCNRQRYRMYCEKHCGYCNGPPSGKVVKLITNVSMPIRAVRFADYITDEYPNEATYEITSQSNTALTNCVVGGELCQGRRLVSNLTIQCTQPEKLGSSIIDLKLIDECNFEDLKLPGMRVALVIDVINATTMEAASQLGLHVDG